MGNTLQVKRGTNLSNAGTPAAGELIYKTDTNQLFVGDGSTAATSLTAIGGSGSGDIEGVTAGTGLSGGGTSGTVTLTLGNHSADLLTSGTVGTARLNVPSSGDWFSGGASIVATDGVMEIGRYIDFHNSDTTTDDYHIRLDCESTSVLNVQGGTLEVGGSQVLTAGDTIDISSQTNLSAGTNISLSGDTLNVDDAFLINSGNDTTSGTITAAGFTTSGTITVDDIHGNSNSGNRLVLDDDTQSGLENGVSLTGVNTIYIACDETNNGVGEVRFLKGTDNDLDSGTSAELARFDNSGNLSFREDSSTQTRYIHLPRAGGITFYGDKSQHHGIFSRDDSNSSADDLLISSYGAVYIDLDSNDNNTSNASFEIGKHNTANDPIFMVDGETGHVGINENSLDADLHITGSPVVVKLERAGQRAFRFGVPDDSTKFIMADSDDLKSNIAVEIDNSRNVKITENLEVVGDLDVDGTTNLDAVDIDGVITAADGSASNPQYSFGADTNSGMFRVSSDVVGIAAAGNSRFTVKGNGIKAPNGSLGVNTDPNSTDGMIHATNDIVAFSSDKRLKENIRPIENALDKVSKLSGFVYNWNELANQKAQYDMDKDYVGVYAQDVEEVQPEAVDLAPFDNDGEDKSISGDNYLTVKYDKLVPLLIESIKELKAEIEELKK
tara:strand:+ start:344 stop:2347 length:2004 start_codon:yes stop_codon:yes gene_type:complete